MLYLLLALSVMYILWMYYIFLLLLPPDGFVLCYIGLLVLTLWRFDDDVISPSPAMGHYRCSLEVFALSSKCILCMIVDGLISLMSNKVHPIASFCSFRSAIILCSCSSVRSEAMITGKVSLIPSKTYFKVSGRILRSNLADGSEMVSGNSNSIGSVSSIFINGTESRSEFTSLIMESISKSSSKLAM